MYIIIIFIFICLPGNAESPFYHISCLNFDCALRQYDGAMETIGNP